MNVLVACDPDLLGTVLSMITESRPDLTPRIYAEGAWHDDAAFAIVVGRRPSGLAGLPVVLIGRDRLREDIEAVLRVPPSPGSSGGEGVEPVGAGGGPFMDDCPIGLFVQRDWVFTEVNPAFCRVFGYDPGELEGRLNLLDLAVPGERMALSRTLTAVQGGRTCPPLEFTALRRDGVRVPAEVRLAVVERPGGRAILGSATDATARRTLEETLQRSERLTRAVLDNSPFAITVRDSSFRLLAYNRAWKELWRIDDEEVLRIEAVSGGMTFSERFPHLRESIGDVEGLFGSGGRLTLPEQHVLTPSGGRWISHHFYSVPGVDGGVDSFVIMTEDVTVRRRYEAELERAGRMESMGLLLGKIVHEFNNLLTPVMGYADLALSRLDGDGGRREVEKLSRAAGKASSTIERLMAYGRRKPLSPRHVDLRRVVEESVRRAGSSPARAPGPSVELPPEPVVVLGDPVELELMIESLAVHSPGSGRADARALLSLSADAGTGKATLTCSDGRTWIDQETAERLFEPFSEADPPQGGLGLGLPLVQAVARRHGGDARAVPDGSGSGVFEIELPLAPEGVPAEGGPEAGGSPRRGLRVLLAEDDEDVRDFMRDVLTEAGCIVQIVVDGSMVLPLLERGFCPDVVIADSLMPVTGAEELHGLLSEDYPDLPFLVISGYPGRAEVQPWQRGMALLEMPFTAGQLLEELGRLTGPGGRSSR
jgi:PAS domain S-box-containing protein